MGETTCWHCLAGHLGPGAYMVAMGVLFTLEAAGAISRRRRLVATVAIAALFVPAAMAAEALASVTISMANIHHFLLYAIVGLDAVLIVMSRLLSKPVVPAGLTVGFQALQLPVMGFMFFAHNTGNSLFLAFHQVMFPGLALMGVAHYACESSPRRRRVVLEYVRGIGLTLLGSLFANIGYGFFLTPDGGILGDKHDAIMSEMAWGMLSYIVAMHLVAVTTCYALLTAWLAWRGLLPGYAEDDGTDGELQPMRVPGEAAMAGYKTIGAPTPELGAEAEAEMLLNSSDTDTDELL